MCLYIPMYLDKVILVSKYFVMKREGDVLHTNGNNNKNNIR